MTVFMHFEKVIILLLRQDRILSQTIIFQSTRYAGQLGPWSKIVSLVGIPPRSTFMKLLFILLGVTFY